MIKISTFNVNSVKARLSNLLVWLQQTNPDIVCLQELKCLDFPAEPFEDLGYNLAINPQKTYNGVAILSKYKINEVVCLDLDYSINSALPSDFVVSQARYIEVLLSIKQYVLRVASVYVPNGGADLSAGQHFSDHDKFIYKLEFLQRLHKHWQNNAKYSDELQILGGDFNVACHDIDIHNPEKSDQLLFSPQERQQLNNILNLPLLDCYRLINGSKQQFSWWHYQAGAFAKNLGARIDYLLCSSFTADYITNCYHESTLRSQNKPSDHCPVTLELNI
jgi:exodeoxyribonuclease-3